MNTEMFYETLNKADDQYYQDMVNVRKAEMMYSPAYKMLDEILKSNLPYHKNSMYYTGLSENDILDELIGYLNKIKNNKF